jgi:hypothetical protein
LRIQHQRARYLGLYNEKGGGQHVHFNLGGGAENAEDTGIEVHFVHATKWGKEEDRAKVAKAIEGFPVADLKPL